ncbi:hypothetical protein LCGC14_0391860 [marine sediment metagenome]|uniref:Uncharacterized protein n=1 Tax=marine sediment metagenome TaxID=412755 RepID=A0A0F9TH47_9ZZZZ
MMKGQMLCSSEAYKSALRVVAISPLRVHFDIILTIAQCADHLAKTTRFSAAEIAQMGATGWLHGKFRIGFGEHMAAVITSADEMNLSLSDALTSYSI